VTTYPNPVAFCFMEPFENTGGIIFARSNIEARKIGASEWNEGEIGGCQCRRAPLLDKYAGVPVSGVDMIMHYGWWIECSGCGRKVDADAIEYDGLDPIDAGHESVWCCKRCMHESKARKFRERRLKRIVVNTMVEDLQRRVPGVEVIGDDAKSMFDRPHVDFGKADCVQQATIAFTFPGMKMGPGHYRIDRDDPEPKLTVCAGDHEAFKAWRDAVKAANAA
jgi:hypothetical protein